jgi:hypothetical protein
MERYNQRPHSTTGQAPIVLWRQEHPASLPQAAPLSYTKFCFQCNKLKFQFADNPDLFNRKPITENRKRYYKLEPRLVSWDGYVHVDGHRYPAALAFAGQDLWVERVMGRWLQIKDAGLKPVLRYDLLREKGITPPHPEHGVLAKAYPAKKADRRARAKMDFLKTFPDNWG